jgi:membrane-associated phospholipid phosphatase
MNDQLMLICDIYSIVPLAIYFAMFYFGICSGNINEALGFMVYFFINNEITSIIKRLPYPESLWEITRRPEGSFNTDYLSRNGPSKKDAPGFPSGHMTSIAAFAMYMVLRKKGDMDWDNFIRENMFFFLANILSVLMMGFARWYKNCHNMTQIIAGTIYGSVTAYFYFNYIGKYLIVGESN